MGSSIIGLGLEIPEEFWKLPAVDLRGLDEGSTMGIALLFRFRFALAASAGLEALEL